ncbi:MAG: T9SS type A sorting domain-containing protein, partial [Flavobacteriales bacterium]
VASNMVRYQFRFRIPGEYPNPGSCIVRPPQMSPTLHLNWTSGDKLKCNTQYEVDVRVSKDGGATWCVADGEPTCSSNPTSWGKVCMVNIGSSTFCPNNAQGGSSAFSAAPESNFTFYPNPNNGEAMFLSATGLDHEVMTLSVDIFDMTGKRVLARTLGIQDGLINTSVDLNTLQSGVYLVNLTAGARTYTERLVIQR